MHALETAVQEPLASLAGSDQARWSRDPDRRRPPPPDSRLLKKTLREQFGLRGWRPGQEDVISSVLAGRDTLAIMPTGAGKSLCYQLPALFVRGTTVVVSPLIALMKDQVEKLDAAGFGAEQLNSALSARQEADAMQRLADQEGGIVFATPERLSDPDFIAALRDKQVSLFVVDEAHCISQWGHDFRPAFLEIGQVIETLDHPTVLALTATATERVVDDICRQLHRPRMRVIQIGVYRTNLHYRVIPVRNADQKLSQLLNLVNGSPGSGIVYCATVKAAEALYAALRNAGVDAARYHGRLSPAQRIRYQDLFMSGRRRVMVATNAFGMGIDKSDIRYIVHYQMPGSLEAYYQESGRAGRDGEPAACVLLYDPKDKHVQQFFLARRYPGVEELAAVYVALHPQRAADGDDHGDGLSLAQLHERVPGIADAKLVVTLKLLKDARVVAQHRRRHYCLRDPADKPPDFERLTAGYQRKAEHDRDVLERMVGYAQTALCRWKLLLEYFGDTPDFEHCGHCDNCRRPVLPRVDLERIEERAGAAKAASDGLAAFVPGDRVVVVKYGRGEVVEATDTQVTVAFADGSRRSFVQRYVRRLRDPAVPATLR